jgi:DnaK suppressor protein
MGERGENHMEVELIEQLRLNILKLKVELEETSETAHAASSTVTLDQSAIGRVSRIDALQQQQIALESERRRQQTFSQIEGALIRIKNGDFGYCYLCGEDIGIKRLQLNPLLTRCLKCAT